MPLPTHTASVGYFGGYLWVADGSENLAYEAGDYSDDSQDECPGHEEASSKTGGFDEMQKLEHEWIDDKYSYDL